MASRTGGVATTLVGLAIACEGPGAPPPSAAAPRVLDRATPPAAVASAPATYVGSASCGSCHAEAAEAWSRSHHAHAMERPTETSLLGRFDGAPVRGAVETFRFVREPDEWVVYVRPHEPDAVEERRVVRWTFGYEPLQQLLVDGERGRLQALTMAWDSRAAESGGQRWFELGDPGDPPTRGDPLHWDGRAMIWNSMCAACHATDVDKGYDFDSDHYATTFAEPGVGCEACHGPGSAHVSAASEASRPGPLPPYDTLAESRRWMFGDGPTARLFVGTAPVGPGEHRSAELDRCAPCHSLRADLGPPPSTADPVPFDDRYAIATPDEPLYFADGQAREEVYVLGSLLQSKMGHAGVTCRDCHDPHGPTLRVEGDALCSTCHQAETFATPNHHHHDPTREGARCVSCHMPVRTYMGVDRRRDHRFSIPRPDLPGVPNTCATCHADAVAEDPTWARVAFAARHGPVSDGPSERLGRARSRRGTDTSNALLGALVRDRNAAPLVRAAALNESARLGLPEMMDWIQGNVASEPPVLRRVAAEVAPRLPAPLATRALASLASDPVRSVRLAARAASPTGLPGFDAAAERDYAASLALALDRPGGILNAALAETDPVEAERLLARGVVLHPDAVALTVNLAELQRRRGAEAEAEATLRAAIERASSPDPIVHHALGLSLVRQGRSDDGLRELLRAAELAPADVELGFTAAIALWDTGQRAPAITRLEALRALAPDDRRVAEALAAYRARVESP